MTAEPRGISGFGRANFDAVARFDDAVDKYFDAHLRGRPALDRLMYGASAAADHSGIWLVLAALQAWRSGSGWRPLVRAGALLGGESALVNGLVKLAFRRERPETTEARPLHLRVPLTSSFPSGHSSAAFFAATLLSKGPTRPRLLPFGRCYRHQPGLRKNPPRLRRGGRRSIGRRPGRNCQTHRPLAAVPRLTAAGGKYAEGPSGRAPSL